jgi:hypothetical protein
MKISQSFKVHRLVLTTAQIIGLGQVTHATAKERAYLIDLNSTTVTAPGGFIFLPPIPEPETYAMLLAGLWFNRQATPDEVISTQPKKGQLKWRSNQQQS